MNRVGFRLIKVKKDRQSDTSMDNVEAFIAADKKHGAYD